LSVAVVNCDAIVSNMVGEDSGMGLANERWNLSKKMISRESCGGEGIGEQHASRVLH
jgi:hypothetical protein